MSQKNFKYLKAKSGNSHRKIDNIDKKLEYLIELNKPRSDKKCYRKIKPVLKWLIFPLAISLCLYFLTFNDKDIRKIDYINVLLNYLHQLWYYGYVLLPKVWFIIPFIFGLGIGAVYFRKNKAEWIAYVFITLIWITSVIVLSLFITIYVATFDEKSSVVVPLYYAGCVIGYDLTEKFVILVMRDENVI